MCNLSTRIIILININSMIHTISINSFFCFYRTK
nr:MAG TPA: hypothetical protein [Caudoviricetes sp.]